MINKYAATILKHFYCLLLFAICLLTSICLYANPSKADISQNKTLAQTNNSYDYTKHNNRMRELDWIEFELNSMNSIFPNPSPDEIIWIQNEKNDISQITDKATKRVREDQLYSSIAFQKHEIKTFFLSSLGWVRKIKLTTNIREEMIYWVELATIMSDRATLYTALDTLKDTIKYPYYSHLYFDAAMIDADGRSILSTIIIPYIESGMSVSEQLDILQAEASINPH